MSVIRARFTPARVDDLNRWQNNPSRHPYTCDRGHALIAVVGGWRCPSWWCRYRQDWASAVGEAPSVRAAVTAHIREAAA